MAGPRADGQTRPRSLAPSRWWVAGRSEGDDDQPGLVGTTRPDELICAHWRLALCAPTGQSARVSTLRLRPLEESDEAEFVKAHDALAAESFAFGIGYQPGIGWSRYLAGLEAIRLADDLPPELVPATFLIADVDGVIVGRTSVRHRLNGFLAHEGGHIGYAVLAQFRCRGYATEILRQSLPIARSNGVDRVLITCDDNNVASATVIERCGGMFESVVASSVTGTAKRRYWVE